jgi:hypothetical protein
MQTPGASRRGNAKARLKLFWLFENCISVIASTAKQSIVRPGEAKAGLLRRLAPRNDEKAMPS